MNNQVNIQGILSIAALVCLLVGWFNFFTPELNSFLYNKLFYILIGASFFLQAPTLSNQKMVYPMYIAAAMCVVGALLPENLGLNFLKTVGLFGGVIISFMARPRLR